MKFITLLAFHALLDAITKGTFVSMVMITPVRMNKTGNPFFGRIRKVRRGNFLVGNDYEKRVIVGQGNEGQEQDFEAQASKVGVHVSKVRLFNANTQNSYVSYERFDNSPIETCYIDENGNEVDYNLFKQFITGGSDYKNQGLQKPVKWQTVTTTNVDLFTMNGTTYKIVK